MTTHLHEWIETHKGQHCLAIANKCEPEITQYVKCKSCKQIGFRYLYSKIVYTWQK